MDDIMYAAPTEMTGENIRLARLRLGLTQREFANLLNTSKPTVERWESAQKPVHGPVTVLLSLLLAYPELIEKREIPPKEVPLRMLYMYRDQICTLIDVDERNKSVSIRNYTNEIQYRAFGVNETPDYETYEAFLASRCFPEQRDKMKLILKDLDLPFYDPFLIVQKTEGRMAEDDFWIRIVT